MTRLSGVHVVFALVAASAGCGVGGGDGGTTPPGGTPVTPVNDGQLCEAHFTITGTFTPGTAPRPTDPDTGLPLTACWPVGQWSFTATVSDSNCSSPPAVLSSYSFTVDSVPSSDGTGNDQVLTNTTTVGSMKAHLAMSLNGQGCQGALELGSADGKDYWNMKPTLSKDPADRALAGEGDYAEFKSDSWPWKSTSP
ncbi:MAG TPA: hypothetical protein VF516_22620 [Kofleriaceae bacterium]